MAEGARLESVYTATYRGFESSLTVKYNPLNFNGFLFLDLRDFFLDQLGGTIMYLSKMPPAPTTLGSLAQDFCDRGLPFAIRYFPCTKDRQLL